ncbi:MAG: aryl-sulfate sulfotransferase [Bryobacteraceae bacterium]
MKRTHLFCAASLLAAYGMAPVYATVTIQSLSPSVAPPQPLGTVVNWTAKATDSNPNDLTFQFNVTPPNGPLTMVKDFNIGTLSAGIWKSQGFTWATIAGEGTYTIQVIAKDFVSGETATKTASFQLTTRVSGGVASVNRTGNALVALFSAPSCAAGSTMRVAFYTGTAAPNYTTWAHCQPPVSMNVYVAGMLPSTAYAMYSQTDTGGSIVNGATLTFTTQALPTTLPRGFFPTFAVNTAAPADDPNPMLLWSFTKVIVPVATDLNGNIDWYYGNGSGPLLTRPVAGGTMLTIQNGPSWDSSNTVQQLLREIDLAGNTVRETNTGAIANQLVALGSTDATPCGQITPPFKAGDACLNDFHHDAIRYSIGSQQYTAFMAHIEKLFPPGTQGSKGTALVDVLSEFVIVLNSSWQVVWYYDAFQQLDINRTAPLGETCSAGASDCPTQLYLSTKANDWTHANTLDYVAASSAQNPDSGDLLVSMRNQDQVIKINYNNGAGSCAPPPAASCIAWYMGPPDGYPPSNFTIANPSGDPWPWFSHQHDVTYASSGVPLHIGGLTGPLLTIFDNGNTRYSPPPLGLGSQCGPSDCNSRGMALIVDEASMTVTPVMLQDLGVKTTALGGAGFLSNGNFFFQTGTPNTQAIEILPTTSVFGTQVMNVGSVDYSFRGWQMPNLYNPPSL